jgi:hypothetical protein
MVSTKNVLLLIWYCSSMSFVLRYWTSCLFAGNTVAPANASPPASGKNHGIERAPPPKKPSTAPVHKSPTRGNLSFFLSASLQKTM